MYKQLTALLLALPFICAAQSNYKPGYLVTNEMDTIKGFIDYKERSISPSSFNFKRTKDGASQEYNLKNASAYGVDSIEHLRRYQVKISLSKVGLDGLSTGLDTTSRTDSVYLRVLETGKHATLYVYEDRIKKRFFIQRNDATPVELGKWVYMKSGNPRVSQTYNKYQDQLRVIKAELNPGLPYNENEWKHLSYVEADLRKAVATLNGQELTPSNRGATRFYIGGGLNVGSAAYTGENPLAGDNAVSKRSYLPFIAVGFDIFANPAIGKLIWRMELALLANQYHIQRTETSESSFNSIDRAEHVFNQYTAQFSPQVLYNVYNTDRIKVNIYGSFSFNLSRYDKSSSTINHKYDYMGEARVEVVDDPIDFKTLSFAPRVGTGLVFNNRMEFTVGYSFPSSITSYSLFGIDVQRLSFGVNFLFGK